MELTPYEQNIFDKLDRVDCFAFNVDYVIKADRPDRLQLIEAIKKYIQVWNNYEFGPNYTKFRRCPTLNRLQTQLPKPTTKQMLETLLPKL